MGGSKEADPEKEKKRQKALRRMAKILGKAWELPHAEPFQTSSSSFNKNHKHSNHHHNLSHIGEKIDQEDYRYGRHGWEDFSKDIGSVYNRHIHGYVVALFVFRIIVLGVGVFRWSFIMGSKT